MTTGHRRFLFTVARAALLGAASVLSACQGPAQQPSFFSRWLPRAEPVAIGQPLDREVLAVDSWAPAVPTPELLADAALPRMRHAVLDEIFARPPSERPALADALADDNPLVAANAAIGLARWGDQAAAPVLVRTVRSPQLKLSLRVAAIEALASLPASVATPALDSLMPDYGHFPPPPAVPYVPELHAALLRGLARHIDAASDGRFQSGLRSPAADVRLQALAAWARSRLGQELPVAVVDLRADPDPRIRGQTLRLIAASRHPDALSHARTGLYDYDLHVRLVSIEALGCLGGPEAQALLEKLLLHEPELIRSAAIAALAALGARDGVLASAGDDSWRVRQAVAASLGRYPDPGGAAVARRLLEDTSLEVRKALLASLDAWPLEQAGPLLLTALAATGPQTRQLAADQLAKRWPAAAVYSPALPDERRAAVLADLRSQWTAQFGSAVPPPADIVLASAQVPSPTVLPPDRLAVLEAMLTRLAAARTAGETSAALEALGQLGPELIAGLEQRLVEYQRPPPDSVCRQLLPRYGTTFALLDELSSPDVLQRRRAAARLAEEAADKPLRPLALWRLAALETTEDDALVWRWLFEVIDRQTSEPALALAYAALGHPSAEVRRLACAYLGRRPDVRHARMLLPALADPHVSVVREAVRALGQRGALADPAPLEALLATPDRHLRLDVARSLAVLGSPAAGAALERLAHDFDPDVRRQAAETMGQLGDAVYAATLIGLLDDGLGVRRAALAALVKIVGCDVSQLADGPPPALLDRVVAWKQWWQHEGQAFVARSQVRSEVPPPR